MDAGKRKVHKRAVHVIVVGRTLNVVTLVGKEGSDNALEVAVIHRIAQVGREDFLHLEFDDIILGAGRDIGVIGAGSLGAIEGMAREAIAAIQFECDTGLGAIGEETVHFTLAIRVLGSTAIAHLTVALELEVFTLDTGKHLPLGQVEHPLIPQLGLEGEDIVVITETVTLDHLAVGIVHVVLGHVGILGEVALAEVVNIQPIASTQQVLDGLVIG